MLTEVKPGIPTGSIFNVDNSARLYRDLERIYGKPKASDLALDILAGDLKWLSWEASGSPLPLPFFYVREGDKLIHQSDLHWGRDILEGVHPHFRRGLEYQVTAAVKEKVLAANQKTTLTTISTEHDRRYEIPQDCPYTDTQVNVIEVDPESNLVVVRQFQRRHGLDTGRSARLHNLLVGREIIDENAHLDRVLTTVGQVEGSLETVDVMRAIDKVAGREVGEAKLVEFTKLEEEIKQNSVLAAKKLLAAIQSGLQGEALEAEFTYLLAETLGVTEPRDERVDYSAGTSSAYGLISILTRCGGLFEAENFRSGFSWMPSMLRRGGVRCLGVTCNEVNYCFDKNNPSCYKCKRSLPKTTLIAA